MKQKIKEEWKPINGYENYYISNYGNTRYTKKSTGEIFPYKQKVVPGKNGKALMSIDLRRDGVRKRFVVSNLVAEHFIGPKPDNCIVDHIADPKSNYVGNLQYITQRNNVKRAIAKPIKILNTETKEITLVVGAKEAAEFTGLFINTVYSRLWNPNLVTRKKKWELSYMKGIKASDLIDTKSRIDAERFLFFNETDTEKEAEERTELFMATHKVQKFIKVSKLPKVNKDNIERFNK